MIRLIKRIFQVIWHPRFVLALLCRKYLLRYNDGKYLGMSQRCDLFFKKRMPVSVVFDRENSAGNEWDSYSNKILHEFKENPYGFLRQPTISLTVHPNAMPCTYLNDMLDDDFSVTKILPRLYDLPIGCPYYSPDFHWASPLTIQHGHHYMLMKRHLNVFIPDNEIEMVVEFGGGYGNLARLAFAWGYRGLWEIIDLPEMHQLQKHFLSYAISDDLKTHIEFCTLENETMWNTIKETKKESIFIATFSLCETPENVRAYVEGKLKYFKYLFFAYNEHFEGRYDQGVDYFAKLRDKLKNEYMIKEFVDSGQFYMACSKR